MSKMKGQLIEEQLTEMLEAATKTKGHGKHRMVAEVWHHDGFAWAKVSHGVNHEGTHPISKRYARHNHVVGTCAEMEAVIRLLMNHEHELLYGSTVLVARAKREKRGGDWVQGMAKPCEGCINMLMDFKVDQIHYTLDWQPDLYTAPQYGTINL
jgi:cytidine deaminase